MKLITPTPLQQEHRALQEQLRLTARARGELGEAAGTLVRLVHPHFRREDRIALPPLGVLFEAAHGYRVNDPKIAALLARLELELPVMLEEHKAIFAALDRLRAAALQEADCSTLHLVRQLVRQARTEEAQVYPAAQMAIRHARQLMGGHASGSMPSGVTVPAPHRRGELIDYA